MSRRNARDGVATIALSALGARRGASPGWPRRACLAMAKIFLGKDPDYEPLGQWNSGGGMVDWMYKALKHIYQEPEENREALVTDVFAWGVAFTYEAVSAHAEKAEPEDLQDDLVNLADDLTRFLLGVPGNFPDRLFL